MTKPRISQEEAIEAADNDSRAHLKDDYHGIRGIMVNNTSGYVAFDEFQSKSLKLPIVYVSPSGQLILLKEKASAEGNAMLRALSH